MGSGAAAVAAGTDGRHDFDFLAGEWRVHNRKLVNVADPACTEWVEFDAAAEIRPIFGGLGNIDLISATLPDGTEFEGLTVRLFDPATGLWRIWWSSTNNPGHLDPGMTGRFEGDRGEFYGDDVIAGRAIRARFEWTQVSATEAHWQQAFSYDNGVTWSPVNWTMSLYRDQV